MKSIKCCEPECILLTRHIVALNMYRDSDTKNTFAVVAITTACEHPYKNIIVRRAMTEDDAQRLIKKLSYKG